MFSSALWVVVFAAVFSADVNGKSVKSWFPWSSSSSKSSSQNLNWVLDEILNAVNQEVVQQGGDEMTLAGSALNTSVDLAVFGWKVKASVVSKDDGNLKNLSSVIRSSDAGIVQDVSGGSLKDISLKAELSLKDLEVEYSSVDVKVWFVSYSGGLSVTCPKNTFDIAIQFSSTDDSCPAVVQSASIKSLGSCSVKLSNGGLLNWLKKFILQYALDKVIGSIESTENATLPQILSLIVKQNNICKFLNPLRAS